MHRMTFRRRVAVQRNVLPGAALAVSAIALFVAMSGVGAASGLVGQSRTHVSGGVIARTFVVMSQGTDSGQELYGGGVRIPVGHFSQRRPNSIIEVIWTGHVSDRSSWNEGGVCSFQVQLDVGSAPEGEGGKAIVGPTTDGGVPVGVTAFFSGSNEVAPGRHSLDVVVQSTGGSPSDCYMDPGNFRESFVVEEWSPIPR